MMKKATKILSVVAALVCMAQASLGLAAIVDASGQVVDWGFTPFAAVSLGDWSNGDPPLATGAAGTDFGQTANSSWVEGNNSAPIELQPGDPSHVPAPQLDPVDREKFDHEFLGWQMVGPNRIQVLGITSMHPDNPVVLNGKDYHLGDVLLDVNGDGTYDYALTAGQWTTTLPDLYSGDPNGYSHMDPSGLYHIDSVLHGATEDGGFGGNLAVAPIVNPFALEEGATPVAGANLAYDEQAFDYGNPVWGADENQTWLYSWTFDLSSLGIGDPGLLRMHWTMECGNDFLETDGVVPEPATLALLGLGMAGLGAVHRRRRGK